MMNHKLNFEQTYFSTQKSWK